VIRALNLQQKASYIALAAYYLVSIPVACVLVFWVGMGVEGLWIAMAFGMSLQATFYTRLVIVTDWQQVAKEAEERMNELQANIMQDSIGSLHNNSALL
jgi:multidrug resistance protein, MATE family